MKSIFGIMLSRIEFDETVHRILKGRRYSHLNQGLRDRIARLKEAVKKWLEDVLSNLFPDDVAISPAMTDRLSTIAVIVGAVLLLAIIIYVIFKVNRTFEKKKRVKEILGEVINEKTTPTGLRKKASTFVDAGNYRQALRYDFIALLLLMNNSNLIYLDESKTNEEIYQSLKKNKFPLEGEFLKLTNIFNSSWYGQRQPNDGVYEEWSSKLEQIWNGVIEGEK